MTHTGASELSTVPMRFEVTPLPVADIDRAKAFYQRLGWRLDIDFTSHRAVRGVQFTPPGSPASIQFGMGRATTTQPLQGLFLVVDDIEAARDELIGRGADVSEIWHSGPGEGRQPGRDPRGPLLRQPGVLRGPRRQHLACCKSSPSGCPDGV